MGEVIPALLCLRGEGVGAPREIGVLKMRGGGEPAGVVMSQSGQEVAKQEMKRPQKRPQKLL